MRAKDLIKLTGNNPAAFAFEDFTVKGISLDSREVAKDYCFVALRGAKLNGRDFIRPALEKGAGIIIFDVSCRDELKSLINDKKAVFVGVENPRKIIGILASEFFANPTSNLKVTGITGTNGKTTTSFLIEHILEKNAFRSGLIGTVHYKVADHILPASNTTPDAVKLQHLFFHMAEHKLTHAVMEVSSHALEQLRVEGINFHTAIFTNLTRDHLDYHKDMEEYFLAKAKLFRGLENEANAVINSDDAYGRRLREMTKARVIDYAIDNPKALLRAVDLRMDMNGTVFGVFTPKGKLEIKTRLIGRHNVYNILAALSVAVIEGLDFEKTKQAILTMEGVPGRLEKIDCGQPFAVFVDYAHTDDALKNVLGALRELRPKKIITVFGCGGDRDKKKRPLMGDVASRMSDYLIVTNDNPRSEDPEKIAEEIKGGFARGFGNYKTELDRGKAIAYALSMAGENDTVLIAGKGHEDYQIFKDKTMHFDDRETVRKILKYNRHK